MTIAEPVVLASQLLRRHTVVIGAGVYKLLCRLVPSYRSVDSAAVARSAGHFVNAVARFIDDGDSVPLFAIGNEMVKLRTVSGFATSDMIIGVQVYLPVIRKAFLAHAPTTAAALGAYDVVEGVLLPLQARFIQQLVAGADARATSVVDDAPTQEDFAVMDVDHELPEFLRAID
jgi:hypothetical protein